LFQSRPTTPGVSIAQKQFNGQMGVTVASKYLLAQMPVFAEASPWQAVFRSCSKSCYLGQDSLLIYVKDILKAISKMSFGPKP
jgi:hypothetical protein